MCERTFLHSSACVLRSPCGEARRATLLAPFGRFADKPNLRLALSATLNCLEDFHRSARKSPSYVVLASLRTKVKTVCFVSFSSLRSHKRALLATLRIKVKTFISCKACSLRSLKERCSLRSHKGQNLYFM